MSIDLKQNKSIQKTTKTNYRVGVKQVLVVLALH